MFLWLCAEAMNGFYAPSYKKATEILDTRLTQQPTLRGVGSARTL